MVCTVCQVPLPIVETTYPTLCRCLAVVGTTPRNPSLVTLAALSRSGTVDTTVVGYRVTRCPSRSTTTVARWCSLDRISRCTWSQSVIARPLNETNRSPGWKPAALAGDAGSLGRQARVGSRTSVLETATTHWEMPLTEVVGW